MTLLYLLLLNWNLFTPAFATNCDTHFLNHAFVRVVGNLLDGGQLSLTEAEKLAASPSPYNPLDGQTLRAEHSSYTSGIERLLQTSVNDETWPDLKIALQHMLISRRIQESEAQRQRRETRRIFAPSIHSTFRLSHELTQVATLKTHDDQILFAFENADRVLEVRDLNHPEKVWYPPVSTRIFGAGAPHSTVTMAQNSEGRIQLHLHDLLPGGHVVRRRDVDLDAVQLTDVKSTELEVEGAIKLLSAEVLPDGKHSLHFLGAGYLNEFHAVCKADSCILTPQAFSDTTFFVHDGESWGLHLSHKDSSLRVLVDGQWERRGALMAPQKGIDAYAKIYLSRDGTLNVTIPSAGGVYWYQPLRVPQVDPLEIKTYGQHLFATQMYETTDHRLLLATISSMTREQGRLEVFLPFKSRSAVFSRDIDLRRFGIKLDFFTGGTDSEVYLSARAGHSPQVFEPLANVALEEKSPLGSSLLDQTWITTQGQTYVFAPEGGWLKIWQIFRGL